MPADLVKVKKNGAVSLHSSREQAKKFYSRVHKNYYAYLKQGFSEENGAEEKGTEKNGTEENGTEGLGKSRSAQKAKPKAEKEPLPEWGRQRLAEEIPFFEDVPLSEDIRLLLQNDLFYLLVYGMGRKDMDNDWLFARCREVQQNPDNHLDLWAREHYKSTIITVGLTILNVLQNPDITVGIFSHTRPIAKAFLRQIKREWETNMLLQAYFPFVAPPEKSEARTRTWSEDGGLIVRRDGNPKEATLEAWGLVDGQPTGKHFALLIYDDVVTLESVTTPEQIRKTTDAWRLSLNLGAREGRLRMIGTRYHASDTYHLIMEQGSVTPRIHPATADGLPQGSPVFLDGEVLKRKRRDMGAYVFACQMLQNPLADNAMGFKKEWFQTLPSDSTLKAGFAADMNRYVLVDPASSKKEGSDYTSMWVVGLNHDGFYYVLDGVHDRLALHERAEALFCLHRKHRPLAVGYEQYGIQADIEHIKYRMEQENYRFPIVALGGSMAKTDRIRRLVPVFEQGRMWFPHRLPVMKADRTVSDLVQDFYRNEYLNFPVAEHDDMLDCLSRVLDPKLGAVFPFVREDSAPVRGEAFFAG